ncbi:UDP-N-acetylmuramoyl-tripeptide--D-alanyl-D-alanine ligase [Paraflavitalea soli]|uniref:UDP-N-acetylmuramoyl-tripeptide--D-alanyl-D-alanine ligase n=1 Tax=Paraflavitalea soli TaxID=2315862 RepID=A0A3B7MSS8_9BACT|nr:UDP-N-acetylmuramoyl-tripeptide--D-alanyl-D-alanine ligase [Paraflavitalea soli]AXY76110.1 UDP-N-acetylmuramoyl-tripeptide--D-alanyl-D-alanine ligase [Paraflavitalea soli]
MTIEQLYTIFQQYPSVQTDTRALKAGDLFFALKGPNFNANQFAEKALAAGAAYAVVDEPPAAANDRIIVVKDVLDTLQQLAKFHRRQFNIPFIAITGSNGKTTTKELVSTVLSATYKTYTTQGNLNNHIGVPLTILRVQKDAEMAVIEMGANHQQEIAGYCAYTLPTHGIITNAGKAHLEGFGGVEGVRKGKGELYDYLRAHDGTAFVMWDYDYLQNMSKGIPTIIKYGTESGDVTGQLLQSEPFLSVGVTSGEPFTIQTQLVGAYNLPNVLVAVTVGKHFKVADGLIKKAIESYAPSNSRSQLIEKGDNKFILDAYNANPSSMKAAIENFAAIQADHKVLMLGAMAELGPESLQEHEQIVSLIQKFAWKAVVLVGGDFMKIDHPFIKKENALQAGEWFRAQAFHHSFFLIKGSRSMQMEKVLSETGASH